MARRCSRSWHSLTCTSPAGRLRLPDDDSGQNSPACHRRRGNFCQRRSLRSQPPSAAPASAWRPAPRRPRRTPLHDCERAPGGGWNCCGVRDREIPVRIGLHGGPGRTRTSNQTVMSAVIAPEMPIKSAFPCRANQSLFASGSRQSLAKRWLEGQPLVLVQDVRHSASYRAAHVSVKLRSPSFSIEVTSLSPDLSQICLSLG